MPEASHSPLGPGPAQELIEELLRTGIALSEMLAALLEELPAELVDSDEAAALLLEMVIGSCRPVAEAAGDAACRGAIALIGAVGDRVVGDLRAAAELAGEEH